MVHGTTGTAMQGTLGASSEGTNKFENVKMHLFNYEPFCGALRF